MFQKPINLQSFIGQFQIFSTRFCSTYRHLIVITLLCLIQITNVYSQEEITPLGATSFNFTPDPYCNFFLALLGNVNIDITTNQGYSCSTTSAFGPLPGEPEKNWTCDPIPIPGNTVLSMQASRTGDDLNGVTTFDLVLIQRHLLGITPITDPFLLIAADATNSDRVNTDDITQLQNLILGNITSVPAGSWRFISRWYFKNMLTFCNAFNNDPFDLGSFDPGLAMYDTLKYANGDAPNFLLVPGGNFLLSNFDFYGMKVGDINKSAVENGLLGSEDRSVSISPAYTSEGMVSEGFATILFKAKSLADIVAFQMGIKVSPDYFKIIGVEEGEIPYFDHENYAISEERDGEFRVLWFDKLLKNDLAIGDHSQLFGLKVKVLRPFSSLKGLIEFDDAVLKNLSYNKEGGVENLGLEISIHQGRDLEEFTKDQISTTNYPNPFKYNTNIDFYLPQSSFVTIKILDVTGKLLMTNGGYFEKGENSFKIENAEILPAGNLFYQITSAKFSATGKMTKMK